ncbi:MAG: protein-L-isoaspartate(D-aspartate) O-methyltransferase [Phycisphaerae bacterium]|nr:protein-L-isoaspartate(D-aspartate) O-methyltransferase [Phycisphaerae bacterium]
MVDHQLRARSISCPKLLEAFMDTPRELFIPAERRGEAYDDCPVPIGFGQTISQPYVVALMIQELEVGPQHTVLDVGAGSGYQTALLARLAKQVYAVERIAELTERAREVLTGLGVANVTLCTQDGSLGWPEHAPFDRIICGAAAVEVPPAWVEQLADGGRIILPLGGEYAQTLVAVQRRGNQVRRQQLCGVRFVKLIGRGDGAWPEQ